MNDDLNIRVEPIGDDGYALRVATPENWNEYYDDKIVRRVLNELLSRYPEKAYRFMRKCVSSFLGYLEMEKFEAIKTAIKTVEGTNDECKVLLGLAQITYHHQDQEYQELKDEIKALKQEIWELKTYR
jgi:hypothetical protein